MSDNGVINMNDEPLVRDILEFGQGDDDCVFEAFQGIHYLLQGYYTLVNYGDDWWKNTLNQDVWCDQLIKEQWEKVDWEEFETAIEIIYKVMCGSYVRESKFYEALENLNERGIGFRPKREKRGKE